VILDFFLIAKEEEKISWIYSGAEDAVLRIPLLLTFSFLTMLHRNS